MGQICCNNNTRINQTRLITIEGHIDNNINDNKNNNNESKNEFEEPNLKISFCDIENNNTLKQLKRISEKKITRRETVNHLVKNNIQLKSSFKMQNDIKKKENHLQYQWIILLKINFYIRKKYH